MNSKVLSKSFLWMFIGLLTTFITGFYVSTNEVMRTNLYQNSVYIIFCIIEVVLVIVLGLKAKKMNKNTARICFLVYSFFTGLTLSSIFINYKIESIMYIFLITSIVFLVFGLLGYFTNLDLTKFGTYLFMMLTGLLICYLINLFIGSEKFDFLLTIFSLIIFIGFTAYDIWKIKKMNTNDIDEDNLSIIGALDLYLDYINIFLNLLSLIGDAKD